MNTASVNTASLNTASLNTGPAGTDRIDPAVKDAGAAPPCPGRSRRAVTGLLAGGALAGTAAGLAATLLPGSAEAQQWPFWPGDRQQRQKRDAEQRERREREQRARMRARSWAVTVPRGAALLDILAPLPWVRIGPAADVQVYEIGFHRCPPCQVFSRSGAEQLVALGIEVRSLVFAPPLASSDRGRPATANELAAVAAIYRSRSVEDIEAFYADRTLTAFVRARDLAPPERGAPPPAVVDEVRASLRQIVPILDAATDEVWGYPAFLWRTRQGEVKAGFGWGSGRVPTPLTQLGRAPSRG